MRRKECSISEEAAWKIFDESRYHVLSCVDGDKPYAVNISCARMKETLYFHCAKEGRKIDVLKSNNNVCLSCVSDYALSASKFTTYYQSCVIEGTMRFVTTEEEKRAALYAIGEKFASDNMKNFEHELRSMPITEVIAIEVSSISGKRKQPK